MMKTLRIVNRTRGTLLGTRIGLADTVWLRLRGYLGRSRPEHGEGLLLVPCNAVHTYGLGFPLDVVFLGPDGDVVDVRERLRPGRRTSIQRGARSVLELPAGTVGATRTRPGDRIVWRPRRSRGPGEAAMDDEDPSRRDAGKRMRPRSPATHRTGSER